MPYIGHWRLVGEEYRRMKKVYDEKRRRGECAEPGCNFKRWKRRKYCIRHLGGIS